MGNAPNWVWLIVALPLAVPVVIVVMTYLSVLVMAKPGLCLEPADDPAMDIARQQAWADAEGFVWVGAYVFKAMATMKLAIWQHAEHAAYFCVYQHAQGTNYDFVTIFNAKLGVTTGSTKDALFLPPAPGAFTQAFAGLSLDEQFDRHLVAEQYVMDRLGIEADPLTEPFEDVLIAAIKRQMHHVRSIPFWPLRAVPWFLLRRSRLLNLSIEEQERRGLLDIQEAARAAAETDDDG